MSATGDHAGGAVSLSGGRYEFRAGEYRHEGPTGFAATLELDCNATRCRMVGVPLLEIRVVGGELKVVNGATLAPIGSFGGECDWQDVPGAGVVRVLSTGDVDGQTVPTALEFTAGDAGGVGTECSDGGHVVAWDVTATRQR